MISSTLNVLRSSMASTMSSSAASKKSATQTNHPDDTQHNVRSMEPPKGVLNQDTMGQEALHHHKASSDGEAAKEGQQLQACGQDDDHGTERKRDEISIERSGDDGECIIVSSSQLE